MTDADRTEFHESEGKPLSYTPLRLLGEGASGRVELAVDSRAGTRVALKRFPSDRASAARSEARLLAGVSHPGIVRLLDAFFDAESGEFVAVYEFLDGADLLEATRSLASESKIDVLLSRIAEVARALAFVHRRGVLHRDLKPANILVCRGEGSDGSRAVLIDFGFATTATDSSRGSGTLRYLAPEIIDGQRATTRSDLYSLGIVIYELLVGEPPTHGDDAVEVLRRHLASDIELPRAIAKSLPAGLDELVAALLRREPDRRLGSAEEVVDLLERISPVVRHASVAAPHEDMLARVRSIPFSDERDLAVRIATDLSPGRSPVVIALPSGSDDLVTRLRVDLAARGVDLSPLSRRNEPGSPSPSSAWIDLRDAAAAFSSDGFTTALTALPARTVVLLDDESPLPSAIRDAMPILIEVASPTEAEVREAVSKTLEIELPDAILPALRGPRGFTPFGVRRGLAHLVECGVIRAVTGGVLVESWRPIPLVADPAALESASLQLATCSALETEWVGTLAFAPLAVDPTLVAANHPSLSSAAAPLALDRLIERRCVTRDVDQRVALASHALALAATRTATPAAVIVRQRAIGAAILREIHPDSLRKAEAGLLLSHSGDRDLGVREMLDAAIELRAAGRAKEATRFLMHVLEDSGRSVPTDSTRRRALRSLADCASFLGDNERAITHATESLALALGSGESARIGPEAADDVVRCHAILARSQLRRGAFDEAEAEIARGRTVEGALGTTRAVLSAVESQIHRKRGRPRDAAEAAARAIEAAGVAPSPELASAWMERASALSDLGDFDGAAAAYDRAAEVGERIGRAEIFAHASSNLGRLLLLRGRGGQAIDRIQAAVEAFEAAAIPAQAENALILLIHAENLVGDLSAARASLLRGKRLFSRASTQQSRAAFLRYGADTEMRSGNFDVAERMLRESIDLRRLCGSPAFVAVGIAAFGRLLAWRGAQREARVRFAAALRASRIDASSSFGSEILLAVAEFHAFRGRPQRARRIAKRLLAESGSRSATRLEAEAWLAIAVAELRSGDRDACETAVSSGLEIGVFDEQDGLLAQLIAIRAVNSVERLDAAVDADFETALARVMAPGLALERAIVVSLRGSSRLRRGRLLAQSRSAGDAGTAASLLGGARSDADAARETFGRLTFAGAGHFATDWWSDLAAVETRGSGTVGFAGLDRRMRGMERLIEINKAINSELDPQRLLNLILDSSIGLCGARRGFLVLVRGAQLEVKVARNFSQQDVAHPEIEISHSIACGVARTGEPILTSNALSDTRLRSIASIHELRVLSILCVPLRSRNEVLGSIYLDHPDVVDRFDSSELAVLTDFAWAAGIALERARLYQENLERTNDLLRAKQENERLNAELMRRVKAQERELTEAKDTIEAERRMQELRYDYRNIATQSPKMREVLKLIDRITETDFPVLIQGESGTGKELIARAVHYNGPRKSKNFVAVNCAAMTESLIESELFGYMKGAFTGADRDHKGFFEVAHEGSLFLDEIGDMSPEVQKRLLRVIQYGEFHRLGGKDPIQVDVRIICATHRDLKAMIQAQSFRQDLYFRIGVAQVELPPLREREGDVRLLIDHLIQEIRNAGQIPPRRFTEEALAVLERYTWPGNVRELQNEVKRLLFLRGDKPLVEVSDLPPMMTVRAESPLGSGLDGSLHDRLATCEKTIVEEALAATRGNKAEAARRLGISIRGMYKILERIRGGASGGPSDSTEPPEPHR